MLMVPGSQTRFFSKALESEADYVCIDLEGKMIDAASARMAENVVRLDDEIKLKASLAGVVN